MVFMPPSERGQPEDDLSKRGVAAVRGSLARATTPRLSVALAQNVRRNIENLHVTRRDVRDRF